jgi:hypothetical protein
MTFEVCKAVIVQIVVIWVMTPSGHNFCSEVGALCLKRSKSSTRYHGARIQNPLTNMIQNYAMAKPIPYGTERCADVKVGSDADDVHVLY